MNYCSLCNRLHSTITCVWTSVDERIQIGRVRLQSDQQDPALADAIMHRSPLSRDPLQGLLLPALHAIELAYFDQGFHCILRRRNSVEYHSGPSMQLRQTKHQASPMLYTFRGKYAALYTEDARKSIHYCFCAWIIAFRGF